MTNKQNDLALTFTERERRFKAVQKRIQEAYPMAGSISGEDALWRSLTLDATRDLNSLTQRRMQDIAFYLYDTNPMAKRIIDIIPDFVIGDGFTFVAAEDSVYEVIDKFWNDPDNNMDLAIYDNAMELALFGENCFPVWVNPVDGAVKLGYIDPATIQKVSKKKGNPRINDKVFWRARSGKKDVEIPIINVDRKTGKLEGECFYFAINKAISAARGRSDLLSLADWLDGHDQFLFARLERAFLINTFIWDITCEGMDKEQLDAFIQGIPTPKPGSMRAHNEKVTWQSLSPKLEASDASQEASLFKNQILGGAGYPSFWFGEGENTTRATALSMGLPTLKKLRRRQKIIKFQYKRIIDFVLEKAIEHGTLPEKINTKYELIPSPIVSRDNRGLAEAMRGFVDGLVVSVEQNWLTNEEARNAIRTLIAEFGSESFSTKDDENPEEEPDNKKETPRPKPRKTKEDSRNEE